jgi:CIC family chloride channel protein
MKGFPLPPLPSIRKTFSETLLLNGLAVAVGILCGFVAVFFRYLIYFFQNLFFFQRFSLGETSPILHSLGPLVFLVPAIGGLLVGLLTCYLAFEAKGHGVPEVMEAVAFKGGVIRKRVVAVKSLASAVCIGSGGSVGREGPIVQIASATGSSLAQALHLPAAWRKILVGCGGASGIAATFNTPVAGVVFALEILLTEFKVRSFVPLVVSVVFATVVSRAFLGSQPAFLVPAYSFVSPWELILYMALGTLTGVAALLTIFLLYRTEDFFDGLKLPSYLKPASGGFLIGLIGLLYPQIFGIGYETVGMALVGNLPFTLLMVLALAKVLAFSLTLGSGGSGGIFSPSLFIGAMMGGAFGTWAHGAFPGVTATHGAYALVGMAALFSGTSGAPLTAILILFEMTRDYNIILPLMFACVISASVARSLYGETIYTEKLKRRGLRVRHDMEVDILNSLFVADYMRREVTTLPPQMPLREVPALVVSTGFQGFPVVDEKGDLVGILSHRDISRAVRNGELNLPVLRFATREVLVTYPRETLGAALDRIVRNGIGRLPVVDPEHPKKVIGILTRSDILDAYRRRFEEER